MESKAKLFGHPIHPMLIVFPFGLLATGVIFDVIYLITRNTAFPTVSYWMIAAGVIGGLLAAVFGFIDWLAIPNNTRAKKIGLWHGVGNVVIVVLFAISWFIRRGVTGNVPGTLPLVLELIGAGAALLTGWLGGELVYRLRIAVDNGANPDAPSSLSGKPASPTGVKRPRR